MAGAEGRLGARERFVYVHACDGRESSAGNGINVVMVTSSTTLKPVLCLTLEFRVESRRMDQQCRDTLLEKRARMKRKCGCGKVSDWK